MKVLDLLALKCFAMNVAKYAAREAFELLVYNALPYTDYSNTNGILYAFPAVHSIYCLWSCDPTENHTHVAIYIYGFPGKRRHPVRLEIEAKQVQERQELYTMAGLYSKFKSAIVSQLT